MNFKNCWERDRAQREAITSTPPATGTTPGMFPPPTCRAQSQLAFAIVAVVATSVLGGQNDSATESNRPCQTLNLSNDKLPEHGSGRALETFAPAVEKVAPAVVRVVTAVSLDSVANLAGAEPEALKRYLLERVAGGGSHRRLPAGLGSGVIVSEDGFILTNNHLVSGASDLGVTLQDGREFKARVVGLDAVTDVAVLKIDGQHLPTVALAESRNVRVGDMVLAIGHPFGGMALT